MHANMEHELCDVFERVMRQPNCLYQLLLVVYILNPVLVVEYRCLVNVFIAAISNEDSILLIGRILFDNICRVCFVAFCY